MKTFPAAFTAALARNSGTPVWILSLTANEVTYYLSDQGRTIPIWQGGVIVRPWVTSWGQVTEALGLGLAEIRVSDFSASFRIDPQATPNMEDLAAADIEAGAATLWLWFSGLDPATDPPQALWAGFVDDVEIPDDATVTMTFEDGSSRLRGDAGTVITTAAYPTADPDDVGKILPIVYGSVKKVPPVATEAGRLTTLTAELSDSATTVVVLDVTGLAVNDYCDINFETIKITAINAATLTLTISRAQLSTVAALHLVGATLRQQKSLYKLIVHDGALAAIERVMLRLGTDIDITGLVTRYTGAVGSIYTAPGYTGKAVITLTPAQIASIRTLAESLSSLFDPTHGHGAALTSKALIPDYLSVISGLWYGQSVPPNSQTDMYNTIDEKPTTYATADTSGVTCDFSISKPTGSTGVPKRVRIGAQAPVGTITGRTATISLRNGTTTLVSASLPHNSIVYSSWVTLDSGSQTWATVEGYKIRYVGGGSGQYSQLGEIWMEVEFDPSVGNASTGITINSSLESAIGGQILVDATAIQSACLDVVNDQLSRALGSGACTLTGAFPAGYAINGAILKPRPVIEIINQIAFESRAWFRYMAGVPRLIVRPDTLSSARTLTACAVDSNLMRRYRRKKTPVADLINTITLRYGRDYTVDAGDDAYTLTSSFADPASVATYGTRQVDDLFRCDFITSSVMADSVRDYYLGRYRARGWEHRFSVFLDHLPVEFADAVTLAFAGTVVGEVMEARFTPGTGASIDGIDFMVEVAAPPPVIPDAFDPATKDADITLQNSDVTAVFGGYGVVRSLLGRTDGIWTYTLTVDVLTDAWMEIGIVDAALSLANLSLGAGGLACLGFTPAGGYQTNGAGQGGYPTYAQGSTVTLQVDAGTRKARLSNNGGATWSAWTAAISGSGAIHAAVGSLNSVGKQVTLIL